MGRVSWEKRDRQSVFGQAVGCLDAHRPYGSFCLFYFWLLTKRYYDPLMALCYTAASHSVSTVLLY